MYGIWPCHCRVLSEPIADIKTEPGYVIILRYLQLATWWLDNDIGLILWVGQKCIITAIHVVPGDTASGKPGTPKGTGMAGPGGLARSSRNEYMRSGLYSTFTIQSLQPQPQPQPPLQPRPISVLPNTAPAGAAVPHSGSKSTSPSPLEACLETEEAGLPLQVRAGIWKFNNRRDVQLLNGEGQENGT